MDGGQSQARTVPLGGEIGVEDVVEVLGRDALPGVRDREDKMLLLHRTAQGQGAAVGHGVQGVEADVEQGLPQPVGVHTGRGQGGRKAVHQPDAAFFGILGDEAQHMGHAVFQRGGHGAHVTGTREPDELADDAVEAFHLAHHDACGLAVFAAFGEAHAEIGGVALDGAERVADLVGHPGSQRAHGGQVLLAADLFFQTADLAFGPALAAAGFAGALRVVQGQQAGQAHQHGHPGQHEDVIPVLAAGDLER